MIKNKFIIFVFLIFTFQGFSQSIAGSNNGAYFTQLEGKVDKITGKQLSTNDYSTTEQSKLTGIAIGATANSTDINLRDRTTHTGLQSISSITNLQNSLNPISLKMDSTRVNGLLIFKQNTLNGTGLARVSGGTITYDNSLYLTGNQSITFTPSGDVTGTSSGTTSLVPVLSLSTITQGIGTSFSKISIDTKGRVTGNTIVGSSDITTTLGFTPYNSTNPNAYISSVPAQSFASLTGKPTILSGYGITDAYPLSGNPSSFLTTTNATATYLPLIGGNVTGNIAIGGVSPVEKLEITGNLLLKIAGNKIKIATGTNASIGIATLVAGTVTVNTTAVKTGSQVWIQYSQMSGTGTTSILTISSITDSTSFSVNAITAGSALNSTNSSDNNQIKWLIIN